MSLLKLIGLLWVFVISGAAAGAFVTLSVVDPSPELLDEDLRPMRDAIDEAEREADFYSGGLLLDYINLRRQVLLTTEAMLARKRYALVRQIDVQFVLDAEAPQAATEEDLATIREEAERARATAPRIENTAYRRESDVLLQIELVSAAIEGVRHAVIELKLYSAKHGLPAPHTTAPTSNAAALRPTGPPGAVVADLDAL